MMLDRVSTQLTRRRSKCGITLLYLSIQTGTNQTGDATQIASGRCVNGRTAGFANMRAFANRGHSGSSLRDHYLAEKTQLFIYVARVDDRAADFFSQNRPIPRTQACHVYAQMCGGASE